MSRQIEFVLHKDGSCILTQGGNVIWSSDNDDEYQEDFGERIESEDIDDVLEYLEDAGELEDGDSVDIVDENDDGTETVSDGRDERWLH